MRNIQDKKGMSIGDMYPAVLTVVLIGIVLGVGLYVLATFHDQIATPVDGAAQNLINTSVTPSTTTVTDSTGTQFAMSAVTAINNSNAGTLTNYTFTSAGVISWGTQISSAGNLTLVNITYDYIYDRTSSGGATTTTTISGLATFADWIAIIVVVIAAAIVLGIVLSSFGRKRNSI